MKNYYPILSLCVFLCFVSNIFAQQTLFGTVKDNVGDPVIGGTVKVLKGTEYVTGTATDVDGNYTINLDSGEYNIEFSYVGYSSILIEGVEVHAKQRNKLDVNFEGAEKFNFEGCGGIPRCGPLIDISNTTQGMIICSDEIRRVSKPN